MRKSQHSVSLGTFGLAFAVVLSPSFLQTSELFDCSKTGDTTLSLLEFEVSGEDQITFNVGQLDYDVSLPVGIDTATVRAESTDPAAEVSYNVHSASGFIEGGLIGIGGGEVTLDGSLPIGLSEVKVYVKAPGGASDHYSLHVTRAGSIFPCTEQGIRDAITEGGGPHGLDCAGPTTVVTEALIVIDNDVILEGGGDLTVDADRTHRVFTVPEGVAVELRGLTVTGGATGSGDGGGIRSLGTLTLKNSTVSGGWAGTGGGIFNGGTLTLTHSTVSGGWADTGGGIFNEGTLTLTHSTVSGNVAGFGAGIFNEGTLTQTNSTVSGNTVLPADDYPYGGGGILNEGTLTLTNSTVSGNDGADVTGGGIINNTGTLTLTNSLIDGDCQVSIGSVTSDGYNVESPGNTCRFDQATDQVDVSADDLKLGPLQDNGGPTWTHALGEGSVAIDVVPADMCQVDEDQRGFPRDSMCDVGAFEVQP